MDREIQESAGKLAEACRAGQLATAYRLLQELPFKSVSQVALEAGFAVIDHRKRRDFMAYLVSQVAEASRNHTDGYGLRALKDRARQAKA